VPGFACERDVEKEDRVELFFSKDSVMDKYYSLEIDPKGRALSYEASYYRNFTFEWEPPEGFSAAGHIHNNGYTVEGAVPLSFLSDLFDANGFIYAGFYRAQFGVTNDTLVENWLTWQDPITAKPDFHVPSSFGRLCLR
jgi:hypothetical protein